MDGLAMLDDAIPDECVVSNAPVSDSLAKPTITDISSKKCDSYLDVISLQDTTGYFAELPTEYQYLLSKDVPESVSSLIADQDVLKLVWTTILAICILNKDFAHNKDEWVMIVKKGESYLKSTGVKNYKKEISDAISLL